MWRLITAALLAIATSLAALVPAQGQVCTFACVSNTPPVTTTTRTITPLGIYAIASIGCITVGPMAQTVILGRELTMNEAYRTSPVNSLSH
jgi:hypothetical protein